ncbi:MAG: NAD(P)-dependent oxidoreductase [Acidobacteria bacterium]|nr:NAD(P)-dependent oxidoreductase [Acidobacteriota bacterium]MCW5969393.1 NAD(P)-dependent oxidoreductase [Blastocatellales bacterium]
MTDAAAVQSVSVIGLGLMGSALARAFLAAGHNVTVWNRSAEKCQPLVQAGASAAASVEAAVEGSDVIAVCVLDYDSSDALLHTPEVEAALKGKILVQFTTGTPRQARDTESWAQLKGIHYLDAAIMAYPKSIGAPDCTILVSGPELIFAEHRALLGSLGGNVIFVGDPICMACTLETSLLSFYYAAALGFLQGAALCEAEGVEVNDFHSIAMELLPGIGDTIKVSTEMIQKGSYDGAEAAVTTHAAAIAHILQLTREAGVTPDLAECLSGLFEKTVSAGLGGRELPAVFESFRKRSIERTPIE